MNKNDINIMFSHKSDEWSTPRSLFNKLDQQYKFTIDLCSSELNYLCKKHYTKENPLTNSKSIKNEVIFCNPPYSDNLYFCKLCSELAKNNIVIMLLPSRTDTKWFHEYIYNKKNVFIRFIRGRLYFGGSLYCAPFPSMLVEFNSKNIIDSIDLENCNY